MASRAVAEAAPRAAEPGRANRRVQTSLQISTPGDAAEREADSTARKVMSMSAPAIAPRERVSILAARAPSPRAPRTDETSPELAAAIRSQLGGGRPLPADTRSFMEPRFKADLSGVRIHTGAKAENLTTRLGARAFAYGRDIFFNAGQFQPDTPDGMELIAHELTHTIQQREVVQREVQVTERTGPKVQRGIVSEALDWIADKANNIPGYRLFTIVIGRNPINMERVERSGANILRALIEFIPGGHMIVEALENHGVIQKGGKFIEDQFAALGDLGAALRDALMEFIDSLGWRDIFRLGSLWGRAKRIFSVPVDKAIAFGKGLVSGIATLVKDAIIKPLGKWAANNIPKWDLLIGVFGKNPISDDKESPASALIGGFMKLIGQEEIWENIKKGNAVSKAWEWFQKAMKGALSLVLSIPGRVMDTIRSLTIFDIVTIVGAFGKIVKAFSSFVGDFLTWAGGTVLALLEIILSVVAPTMVPYLKKAGAAFNTIIKAPGSFINTLVQAGKAGFNKFVTNIVKHLTRGLLDWLLGSLAGANLYLPQSFTPRELLKFGLSVVGLTWTNVRGKLVAATNETVVKTLESGFDLVKTLVTDGPAAAWQQFLENLSNLKSMVQDAIMDYVKQQVIETAITRLLMMLNPAGAFIAAIQAIYKTVTFIVAKLRQIGALVAAFIDGLAAIAAGQIAPAAARVESVLANGLSLAISFLANYAGLGNISKKVIEIVNKIRTPVDKALDKVVAWVVLQARKLGKGVAQVGVPHDPNERLRLAARASIAIANRLPRTGLTVPIIARAHDAIKLRYALKELTPYQDKGAWFVRAVINPPLVWRLPLPGETDGRGGIREVAQNPVSASGVHHAGVRGELEAGIPRRGPNAAPNYNRQMPGIDTLPASVQHYVQGYQWAHLWGPGFGDEARTGLMLAAPSVNQGLQSRGRVWGLEGYFSRIRRRMAALNGRVYLEVSATSFPDPPRGVPQRIGQPVLRNVAYNVVAEYPGGRRVYGSASIRCGVPLPNGAGGEGQPFAAKLLELVDAIAA
jgi:Domain of unknown function (DUF4157)/Bacterial toxin 4